MPAFVRENNKVCRIIESLASDERPRLGVKTMGSGVQIIAFGGGMDAAYFVISIIMCTFAPLF